MIGIYGDGDRFNILPNFLGRYAASFPKSGFLAADGGWRSHAFGSLRVDRVSHRCLVPPAGKMIVPHVHPQGTDTWTILAGTGRYFLDSAGNTQEIIDMRLWDKSLKTIVILSDSKTNSLTIRRERGVVNPFSDGLLYLKAIFLIADPQSYQCRIAATIDFYFNRDFLLISGNIIINCFCLHFWHVKLF